ncbi:[FeFe] hydrogenase H-cluster radical SAM maturase HydE [Siculibacillus lacustris]|uniref:[FeFe] hydrogenase H-cluster radical SAM maturase HydE n=1 Tax=Siculibacillus lacustris TaxID=1549641 RepID=A0A4Q9VKV3_9HYPH|nr:[FeFe] hydrogenase H-cluster radical SAM maturase HydE [Siculibacillus lacustris]TBW36085.1 [FeFe] hydrogenase H-cluster radical SAM maturase HydE [Siculibacillus lacustris]
MGHDPDPVSFDAAAAAAGPLAGPIDRAAVVDLLRSPREALYARADAVRRAHMGDEVFLRGIVEFSNVCANDCLYCGIRRSNPHPHRYRIDADEILAVARRMAGWGQTTIVLQSGEVDTPAENDRLAALITRIRAETPLAVTVSAGNRPRAVYATWRDAGMDRYLLRFETSDPDLFARLHPDCSLAERLHCLSDLRDLGVQVGSGFMIGLPGETLERLADNLVLVHTLDLDMVGIGPFIAHPDTPLAGQANAWADDPEMCFAAVAALRLIDPDLRVPATTAFDAMFPGVGRDLALQRGADVFMPNDTPGRYRKDYLLYPDKPCVDEGDGSCSSCATARIWSLGRFVGEGPGHSRKARPTAGA